MPIDGHVHGKRMPIDGHAHWRSVLINRTCPSLECTSWQRIIKFDKVAVPAILEYKWEEAKCEKLPASAFCRRRLPVVMVRLRFAPDLKSAVTFIEQGHVRVGPEVVTDPAFLVTRSMEDHIRWIDGSKIQESIARYNDKLDDFDLLNQM